MMLFLHFQQNNDILLLIFIVLYFCKWKCICMTKCENSIMSSWYYLSLSLGIKMCKNVDNRYYSTIIYIQTRYLKFKKIHKQTTLRFICVYSTVHICRSVYKSAKVCLYLKYLFVHEFTCIHPVEFVRLYSLVGSILVF